MRVMFAHDHIFLHGSKGRVYTSGKLPYKVWQRYLEAFDGVTVAGRYRDVEDADVATSHDLASGAEVDFIKVPNLSTLRGLLCRTRAMTLMKEALLRVDAVIARIPSEVGSLAVNAAMQMGWPWAVEVVGCAWDASWYHGSPVARLYAPVATFKEMALCHQASHAIYVTEAFLQQRYPCRGVKASASNVALPKVEEEVWLRRQQKLARDPLEVGMIASLSSSYKGIETALIALSKVPQMRLSILGAGEEGPWRDMAQRFGVADRVEFCGVVSSGAAVFAWLDAKDLYIQPSLTEGLPRALIEAMSRGCPALGSTAGGIPELLDASALHPVGNARVLTEGLQRMATDVAWRSAQAEANFQRAKAYEGPRLEVIRRAFWQQFGHHVADYWSRR